MVKRKWWLLMAVVAGMAATLWVAGIRPRTTTEPTRMAQEQTARQSNRLIKEKSPYLLQHAHNPVDWYPWGEEALARAKREDKPILLSIGYSTCYWCHVMEQESFESPEIAKLMNDWFVSIKVDREERPDLDALYMSAVQAMSGQGGWPMTVFLTPEGKPFWGGTYFPPEDAFGRPGFKTVLRSIHESWQTKRHDLLTSSQSITQALQAGAERTVSSSVGLETLQTAAVQFSNQYDPTHGGFGSAPKFPRSHALSFLLRVWYRQRDPQLLKMVEETLDAMARGGIHDHLGGGFHRYSTDEQWLVPHFEKMLYDQALLARTYLEAYQVTGNASYAQTARDIFTYVLRDLRGPEGAFYSAEDAGEVGKEGEFYVWTPEEIKTVVGEEDAAFVMEAFGVTLAGNFSATQHGGSANQFGGENGTTILTTATSPDPSVQTRLDAARAKLLEARNRRKRPHRDDKILTDWNGLMIGVLAYGAKALGEPQYAEEATRAASFVLDRLQQKGRLLHRYRDGEAAIPAFLDDYAFLSWGLLELYEATFDARWLSEAKRLTNEMVRLFWDDSSGGLFLGGAKNETLIARTKELYDGAVPSGNSVAALVLVRLGTLTMDDVLQEKAKRLIEAFSGEVARAPHAFPQFLIALDHWLGPSQEIVIAGDPSTPQTQSMIQAVHRRFLPRAVAAFHPSGSKASAIEALIPFVANQLPLQGQSTAYVCQNYLCNLPTTDVAKMVELLDAVR